MSNDTTKSSLAFFLSIIIHSLLAIAIVYTGLDMALPEGMVNSTEVDFVGAPQGAQSEDPTQVNDQVAETKVEAPPPPAPVKVEAPKPEPKPVVLPPAPKTVEVADTESEATTEAAPEEVEPEPTVAAAPAETLTEEPPNENPPTDSPVTQEEAPPTTEEASADARVEDNPQQGDSAQNSSAYGMQSDAGLSPAPGNRNPEYPMWARLRRQEGAVIVGFEVLADGSVANTRIIQSSGFEGLDSSALKAHEKWRYRPGKTGTFSKAYNFSLKGTAEEAPSQLRRGN